MGPNGDRLRWQETWSEAALVKNLALMSSVLNRSNVSIFGMNMNARKSVLFFGLLTNNLRKKKSILKCSLSLSF